ARASTWPPDHALRARDSPRTHGGRRDGGHPVSGPLLGRRRPAGPEPRSVRSVSRRPTPEPLRARGVVSNRDRQGDDLDGTASASAPPAGPPTRDPLAHASEPAAALRTKGGPRSRGRGRRAARAAASGGRGAAGAAGQAESSLARAQLA